MTLSTIVKSKTYKIILICNFTFLLLSTMCLFLSYLTLKPSNFRQNKSQFYEANTPFAELKTPYMLSMTKLTLEDCTNIADTFLYGEIEGDIQYYSKNISTGDIELDQKRRRKWYFKYL